MLIKYTINGTYTVGSNLEISTNKHYTNIVYNADYSLVINLDVLEAKNYTLGVDAFLTGMFDDTAYITVPNNSTGFLNVTLHDGYYIGEFEAILFGGHGRFVLKKGNFEIPENYNS